MKSRSISYHAGASDERNVFRRRFKRRIKNTIGKVKDTLLEELTWLDERIKRAKSKPRGI